MTYVVLLDLYPPLVQPSVAERVRQRCGALCPLILSRLARLLAAFMHALRVRVLPAARIHRSLLGLALCALTAACSKAPGTGGVAAKLPPVGDQLFTLLPSSATGIHFENQLVESRDFNV